MFRQPRISRVYRADEYDADTAQLFPLAGVDEPARFEPVQIGRAPWPSSSDLDSLRRKAEKEGYEQGLKRAQEESASQRQRDELALRHLLEGLSRPFEDLNDEVSQEIAALALKIGASLAGRELAADPNLLLPIVTEAIAALPSHARQVTVTLHPDDVSLVRERLQVDIEQVEFSADPRLTRGDCVVQSEASTVDAGLAARIERLCQALPEFTPFEDDD